MDLVSVYHWVLLLVIWGLACGIISIILSMLVNGFLAGFISGALAIAGSVLITNFMKELI